MIFLKIIYQVKNKKGTYWAALIFFSIYFLNLIVKKWGNYRVSPFLTAFKYLLII